MARADRLERLDTRRVGAEAEYEEALVAALRRTAAGSWGLFGHNADRTAIAAWAPTIADLRERAEEIAAMRDTLGLEPFALPRQFEAARGKPPSTAPGEPKQALAWLKRMNLEP